MGYVRAGSGLHQAEAARRAGVERDKMCKWEAGKHKPRDLPQIVSALAKGERRHDDEQPWFLVTYHWPPGQRFLADHAGAVWVWRSADDAAECAAGLERLGLARVCVVPCLAQLARGRPARHADPVARAARGRPGGGADRRFGPRYGGGERWPPSRRNARAALRRPLLIPWEEITLQRARA